MDKTFADEASAKKFSESVGGITERSIGGTFVVKYEPMKENAKKVEETAVATVDPEPKPVIPPYLVIARSQEEMQQAKVSLEKWFDSKIHSEQECLDELNSMESQAIERKWKVSGIRKMIEKQRDRLEWYAKCGMAVRAGYAIIPDFPVDLIAVRTDQKRPASAVKEDRWGGAPDAPQVYAKILSPGEGRYLSPRQETQRSSHKDRDSTGKEITVRTVKATGFREPQFPVNMAETVLMSAAHEAMASKLFDEIGICPPTSRPDPILVGRIHGGNGELLNFLIGWWIDLRTL